MMLSKPNNTWIRAGCYLRKKTYACLISMDSVQCFIRLSKLAATGEYSGKRILCFLVS